MLKVCSSCGKPFPKSRIIKIDGKNYCLECASKIEKSKNRLGLSEFGVPDIIALSVDTLPVDIERYFQAVSAEAILRLDTKSIKISKSAGKIANVISLTYELDMLKLSLLEDLKVQAAIFGANAIIGLRTSMSTIESLDSEKFILVSMSGTPVIVSDTSILTYHGHKIKKSRKKEE
ncbi:TraR/DksA C4-type zinc finger protein [Kosmotoga pacifica]|uniref:Zinc finger DksA/TraR C4-type domain-containing protein n=1 Tax=Kosmotoga pacifica TaxID=1330330 RepID=A0A0G2ZBK8_9BACT|nr:TraR/DksA C4-type zinc finger protein [Kosmotoga pacifica]AKI97456.1 hypothetical protein IX53_06075 [Kosmotoga pacifica]